MLFALNLFLTKQNQNKWEVEDEKTPKFVFADRQLRSVKLFC